MEQEASQLMRGLSSSVDSEATIESLKGLMALIERADGATAEELAAEEALEESGGGEASLTEAFRLRACVRS